MREFRVYTNLGKIETLEVGVSGEQIAGKVDDPCVVKVEGFKSRDALQEPAEFRQVYPVARQRESTEGPDVLSHEIGRDFGKSETRCMDLRDLP